MYSVIFSSRKKDNPDHRLLNLLYSFINCTTPEERQQSEFLIKFDDDDDTAGLENDIKKLDMDVKTFKWGRHGARAGLHETQHYLYRFTNAKTKWLQTFADDFEFTRKGFVSELLSIEDNYNFIGSEDFCSPRCGGTAPCFSRKLVDACGGYFGPQANSDGFSSDLNALMLKFYGIDLCINIEPYYRRLSFESRSDPNVPFRTITGSFGNVTMNPTARNVALNMYFDLQERADEYRNLSEQLALRLKQQETRMR